MKFKAFLTLYVELLIKYTHFFVCLNKMYSPVDRQKINEQESQKRYFKFKKIKWSVDCFLKVKSFARPSLKRTCSWDPVFTALEKLKTRLYFYDYASRPHQSVTITELFENALQVGREEIKNWRRLSVFVWAKNILKTELSEFNNVDTIIICSSWPGFPQTQIQKKPFDCCAFYFL